MKVYKKVFGCIALSLFSIQAFAEDTIKITVKTDEKSAAAVGYTVGGKESGGPGKSYVGNGPKNKEYLFGYRKNSEQGPNISCGALTLTQDSNVTLVTQGDECHSVMNQ